MIRYSPTTRGESIYDRLLTNLELDNGANFKATKEQEAMLRKGIVFMLTSGCEFTDRDIDELTAGETTEVAAAYSHFKGFDELNQALNDIFNNGSEDSDAIE